MGHSLWGYKKSDTTITTNTFTFIQNKELIQLKMKKKKKTQTTQFKNGQRTWIDISLKNKHRSLTGTWKDAQDHKSSGKNKPIPTMRYHLTFVRMVIVKKTTNNKCWWGCEAKGTLVHCWWECKLVQPLWKTIWRVLKNLKISYDPVILLLGTYPKKIKTQI